jgi:putative FmdB family regulatory protein
MPLYEYECRTCGHEWDEHRPMSDAGAKACPKCLGSDTGKVIRTAPGVRGDVFDWSNENNGKGRYISQLQRETVGAKREEFAYCKNRQDIFDKCAKKGWGVDKVY